MRIMSTAATVSMSNTVATIGHAIRDAIRAEEIEASDHQAILDLAAGLAALHIQPERTQGSIDPFSYAVGMAITVMNCQLKQAVCPWTNPRTHE